MMADPPGSPGEYIRRQHGFHELSMPRVADMTGISGPDLSQIDEGASARRAVRVQLG